jgi:hypothetical protein
MPAAAISYKVAVALKSWARPNMPSCAARMSHSFIVKTGWFATDALAREDKDAVARFSIPKARKKK